jgi:hypothetical protein
MGRFICGGTMKFTRLHTNYSDLFDTRWYEINHSGKWTVRYISKRYSPLFDEEICVSHQFQFCGHKMSFSLRDITPFNILNADPFGVGVFEYY